MDFIRITKHKDISLTRPVEKTAEIQADSLAYWEKYVKSGNLKSLYMLPDGRVVAVWDFASSEEMIRIVGENPEGRYLDSETVPAIDYQTIVKMTNEARAAAKRPAKK